MDKELGYFAKIAKDLKIISRGEKEFLGLQNGETGSEYVSRLIKERGHLYGLLHNPAKQKTTTLTKEEIIAQMAEIGKKLDPVYEYKRALHTFGREM